MECGMEYGMNFTYLVAIECTIGKLASYLFRFSQSEIMEPIVYLSGCIVIVFLQGLETAVWGVLKAKMQMVQVFNFETTF